MFLVLIFLDFISFLLSIEEDVLAQKIKIKQIKSCFPGLLTK